MSGYNDTKLQELVEYINDKDFDNFAAKLSQIDKVEDLLLKGLFESNTTVLQYILSSNDKEIIRAFFNKINSLKNRDNILKYALTLENKGGWTAVNRIQQFAEDSKENSNERFNTLFSAIDKDISNLILTSKSGDGLATAEEIQQHKVTSITQKNILEDTIRDVLLKNKLQSTQLNDDYSDFQQINNTTVQYNPFTAILGFAFLYLNKVQNTFLAGQINTLSNKATLKQKFENLAQISSSNAVIEKTKERGETYDPSRILSRLKKYEAEEINGLLETMVPKQNGEYVMVPITAFGASNAKDTNVRLKNVLFEGLSNALVKKPNYDDKNTPQTFADAIKYFTVQSKIKFIIPYNTGNHWVGVSILKEQRSGNWNVRYMDSKNSPIFPLELSYALKEYFGNKLNPDPLMIKVRNQDLFSQNCGPEAVANLLEEAGVQRLEGIDQRVVHFHMLGGEGYFSQANNARQLIALGAMFTKEIIELLPLTKYFFSEVIDPFIPYDLIPEKYNIDSLHYLEDNKAIIAMHFTAGLIGHFSFPGPQAGITKLLPIADTLVYASKTYVYTNADINSSVSLSIMAHGALGALSGIATLYLIPGTNFSIIPHQITTSAFVGGLSASIAENQNNEESEIVFFASRVTAYSADLLVGLKCLSSTTPSYNNLPLINRGLSTKIVVFSANLINLIKKVSITDYIIKSIFTLLSQDKVEYVASSVFKYFSPNSDIYENKEDLYSETELFCENNMCNEEL